MQNQETLAQKNLNTQLNLLKKMRDSDNMAAYCIKNLIGKVDTILKDNMKCVDTSLPVKERKWTMTISQSDWEIVSSLLNVSRDRPVNDMHAKAIDNIKTYQEILGTLQ